MEAFDYKTFKLVYDSDPVIQALVYRFDGNGVELETKNKTDKPEVGRETGGTSLKTSAMAATKRNLG